MANKSSVLALALIVAVVGSMAAPSFIPVTGSCPARYAKDSSSVYADAGLNTRLRIQDKGDESEVAIRQVSDFSTNASLYRKITDGQQIRLQSYSIGSQGKKVGFEVIAKRENGVVCWVMTRYGEKSASVVSSFDENDPQCDTMSLNDARGLMNDLSAQGTTILASMEQKDELVLERLGL